MKQFKLLLIALAALCSSLGVADAGGKMINCYYGTWANYRPGDGKFAPSHIDPNLCTHLSYSFFGISESGEFKVLDPWLDLDSGLGHISKVVALKKVNKNLKVLAVVGGWNEGSAKYSKMAADPIKRKLFIKSSVAFILEHNFDGLDVDWEYPAQRDGSPGDRKNFVILLKELKAALKPLNKELGIAVAAAASSASISYDIPEIVKYVNFINIMTYDFSSHWDGVVGLNAPLRGQGERNVESAIKYWLKEGAPASILVLGVPFYGRTSTLAVAGHFDFGSPTAGGGEAGPYTREGGYLGYNEICTIKDTWSQKWADENSVPFLYQSNSFISYDNVKSIELKADFANSLNLAGIMIWSIETDDFHGKCGVKNPLLKAINNKMGNPQSSAETDSKEDNVEEENVEEPLSPEDVDPPRPTHPEDNGDCLADGIFPNKSDCTRFYQCHNGKRYNQNCPAGLYFDASIQSCNYAYRVQCNQ